MNAIEYRSALEQFGFGQEGIARALGYSGRAGQRWATGEARIPGAVIVLMRLLIARPEMVHVIQEIAPMARAKRRRRKIALKSVSKNTLNALR